MLKFLIVLACILIIIIMIRIVYKLGPFEKEPKIDFLKEFSMQTASVEPLERVKKELVEIRYVKKDNSIDARQVKIYLPEEYEKPYPLIFVPHYEIGEDSAELRTYVKEGWAVASTADFKNDYNKVLSDDDLVFNNAALYMLRNREDIDKQRIALIGGSAGGYMSLMLNALQMGQAVSVISSPITNLYFNFHQYFIEADKINGNAWVKMIGYILWYFIILGDKKEIALKKAMLKIPMPFLGMISGSFTPINENIAADDLKKWEALSAVGLAGTFTSPFLLTHYTSDILVPIDQITRKYTYSAEGETMPKGFSTRLDRNNPGILGQSFADLLPQDALHIEKTDVKDVEGTNASVSYDGEKLFNINIIDEGQTQSYASHDLGMHQVELDVITYVKEMFDRTLKKNEMLFPDKLLLFLDRYQGKSLQLPAHMDIEEEVYGSLKIYQKEIIEELKVYVDNHSLEKLQSAIDETLDEVDNLEDRAHYNDTWNEIKKQIMQ